MENFEPKKLLGGLYQCPHNEYVRCPKPECDGCGWNPAVANARSREILERMKAVRE